MSVINAVPLLAAAGGDYTISRSVRLRSSASAYFNRTASTPTNNKVWTMSLWCKRGDLGQWRGLFAGGNAGGAMTKAEFYTDDTLYLTTWNGSATVSNLQTSQLFRDPSAWYHIVFVYDISNATANNRQRLYVNGQEVTVFASRTNFSTTDTSYWNNASYSQEIGKSYQTATTNSKYFDGYLTEINFIDGQALTPSSFGETDTITGVWKPKKYAGTYGTNGFYLNFSDNSSNTATTIGKDYSGNGNNWTPNNISVTSGVTYDSMLDVPTPYADGGNGRGNYCVINPLDGGSASATTISEGNLKSTAPSLWGSNACTIGVSSGKWYWEQTIVSGSYWYAGIIMAPSNWSGQGFGQMSNGYSYYSTGQKQSNNTLASYGASFTSGDVIGVALDMDAGTITFYKNNTSQGTAYTGLTGVAVPAVSGYNGSVSVMNFGQRPFTYTPPSGYNALNTQNLPAPTISNGALYMAATTYTGNGTYPTTITNGGNNTIGTTFKPDLVWVKVRSNTYDNILYDSVRGTGTGASLVSNSTSAEGANSAYANLTAFASNGFTVGSVTAATNVLNQSSQTFVAWQWQAGQGTTSSNTSGSITSTVSVNATAGFSVVAYNSGASGDKTVGHGLGVAPSMIITKSRSSASYNWSIYHASVATTVKKYLTFTTDALQDNGTNIWGSAFPTSSVFGITSGNGVVASTDCIAYCFSAVKNYSSFGSFVANGSSDGPFVFLGFRPRWILFKDTTNAATNWVLQDTSRFTYNVATGGLLANTSASEYSTGYDVDILSNGFKIRRSGGDTNASGATIVYAAFAENPFRYSLAR